MGCKVSDFGVPGNLWGFLRFGGVRVWSFKDYRCFLGVAGEPNTP